MTMTTGPRRLRCSWWLTLLALALVRMCSPAAAQGQFSNQFGAGGIDRPTTSPYLNLFRGGQTGGFNDIGLNYQRLVRPEQQLRNYSAGLGAQVSGLEQQLNATISPTGAIGQSGTGHGVAFQNSRMYFMGGYGSRP